MLHLNLGESSPRTSRNAAISRYPENKHAFGWLFSFAENYLATSLLITSGVIKYQSPRPPETNQCHAQCHAFFRFAASSASTRLTTAQSISFFAASCHECGSAAVSCTDSIWMRIPNSKSVIGAEYVTLGTVDICHF